MATNQTKGRTLSSKLKPWHLVALIVAAVGYLVFQYLLYKNHTDTENTNINVEKKTS